MCFFLLFLSLSFSTSLSFLVLSFAVAMCFCLTQCHFFCCIYVHNLVPLLIGSLNIFISSQMMVIGYLTKFTSIIIAHQRNHWIHWSYTIHLLFFLVSRNSNNKIGREKKNEIKWINKSCLRKKKMNFDFKSPIRFIDFVDASRRT